MLLEEKTTISNTIYKELLNQICTGLISADTTLTENVITQMFSVSKAPVREALVRLCHENVLESRPRSGYRVCSITPKDIADLSELRIFLELNSLPNINKNIDKKSLDNLRRLSDERNHLIRTEKNVWTLWDNNIAFHLALNKIAENAHVYVSLERNLFTYTRAYAQTYVSRHEVMYATSNKSRHDFIVDALEQHDVFSAYNHLKQDILYLQFLLLQQPTQECDNNTSEKNKEELQWH